LLPGRADAVACVAISGIGPCVVPCDDDDRPLRPAILYGVDTRAEEEVQQLTERLGAAAILARCRSVLSSQALGPKLLWLARHDRRLGGGRLGRRPLAGRADAHVRLDDVPRRGGGGASAEREYVVDPWRRPRVVLHRRGNGDLGQSHGVAARALRRPAVRGAR